MMVQIVMVVVEVAVAVMMAVIGVKIFELATVVAVARAASRVVVVVAVTRAASRAASKVVVVVGVSKMETSLTLPSLSLPSLPLLPLSPIYHSFLVLLPFLIYFYSISISICFFSPIEGREHVRYEQHVRSLQLGLSQSPTLA